MANDKGASTTSLPLSIRLLPCLIQFNVGVQLYMIVPLLTTIVDAFADNDQSHEQRDQQVVILGASYFVASTVSGVAWGFIADRFGRRIALLGGITSSFIGMTLMAFAANYPMAVLARFLMGMDANLGINKAYIGDLVSDHATASRLFSNIMFSLSFAATLSPLISTQLPGAHLAYIGGNGSYYSPAFWPCITLSITALMTLVACIAYLPETPIFLQTRSLRGTSTDPVVEKDQDMTLWQTCLTWRDEIITVTVYCICGVIIYATDYLMPFLVIDGLSLDPTWLSYFLTWQAACRAIFTIIVFPPMTNRLGLISAFRFGLILLGVFVSAVYLPTWIVPRSVSWSIIVMFILVSGRGIATAIILTACIIFVNNSTTSSRKGKLGGTTQSLISITRAIGIYSLGQMYIGMGGQHLYSPFLLMSGTSFLIFLISFHIPSTLDHPKPEPIKSITASSIQLTTC